MSTDELEAQAAEARAALTALAKRAKERAGEVASDRNRLNRERGDVVVGARAAMRNIDDEDEVYAEEAEQLEHIIEGTGMVPRRSQLVTAEPTEGATPSVGSQPPPGVSAILTEQQLTALSREELLELARKWQAVNSGAFSGANLDAELNLLDLVDLRERIGIAQHVWRIQARSRQAAAPAPATPAPPVEPVEPPAPPAEPSEPPADDNVPPVNQTVVAPVVEVPVTVRSPYHYSNWRWCWLAAVLGAFIGLVVGFKTRHFVTDEVHDWQWVPGTIWTLAIGAVGLFAGALICVFVREWLNGRRNNTE